MFNSQCSMFNSQLIFTKAAYIHFVYLYLLPSVAICNGTLKYLWLSRMFFLRTYPGIYRLLLIAVSLAFVQTRLSAQCPPNIGFDEGTFDHWTFDTAGIHSNRVLFSNPITKPVAGRFLLFEKDGLIKYDPYGKFLVTCPNGSPYSIRLGNDDVAEVSGISYTIDIPADKNDYSIVYNYALVLQNPNHTGHNQPRFTAKVFDVSTNQYIECSSFDFAASTGLPGFLTAKDTVRGAGIVYKPWSPVTIKLTGYAGRQVRLEFVVTDCREGGHFGYAYLDVNPDCRSAIGGSEICEGSASTLLTSPFGFKEYRWYNADFSSLLGTENTLALSPAPPANTVIALEIKPYPGSGCVDTLYTSIKKLPDPLVFNVKDTMSACAPAEVDLSAAVLATSTPGLSLRYYTNRSLNDFVPVVQKINTPGTYYITASNSAGCVSFKPVAIVIDTVPEFSVVDPPVTYYPNTINLTDPAWIKTTRSGLGYHYWKDAAAQIRISNPASLELAGIYYIEARTRFGCSAVKPVKIVIQIAPPPNAFSPNGDGINDLWQIRGLHSYTGCSVQVFDRYGRLVFRSTGYNSPWDGTFNGKPLPVATYYYLIKTSEQLDVLAGSVTILR
jgi:gliding motility-associated-like protein